MSDKHYKKELKAKTTVVTLFTIVQLCLCAVFVIS
jgi:hypothetical protein